jgi:hypothetical protein
MIFNKKPTNHAAALGTSFGEMPELSEKHSFSWGICTLEERQSPLADPESIMGSRES